MRDKIDHGLLYWLPFNLLAIAAALVAEVVQKFRFAHWPARFLVPTVATGLTLALLLCRWLTKSPEGRPRMSQDNREALPIACSYLIGLAAGAAWNCYLGGIHLGPFFSGTAPLVGGFVVGIVFSQEWKSGPARRQEVALVYMLSGAMVAAMALIDPETAGEHTALYAGLFLAICGSLFASAYAIFKALIERSRTSP